MTPCCLGAAAASPQPSCRWASLPFRLLPAGACTSVSPQSDTGASIPISGLHRVPPGACLWLRVRATSGQACPVAQIPRLGRSHSPDLSRCTPGIPARAPAGTAWIPGLGLWKSNPAIHEWNVLSSFVRKDTVVSPTKASICCNWASTHPCQVLRGDSTPGRLSAKPRGCTFMLHSHHHPAYASGSAGCYVNAACLWSIAS